MMNWHDGTFTPRGICSFGITESLIAGGAWLAGEAGLFGAGEAAAGAGLFGAETGAFGGAALGEAAGAGLGAAEAASGAEALSGGFGLAEAAGIGGGAQAATDAASVASLAGGGGAAPAATTAFEAASGGSQGIGALSGAGGGAAGGATGAVDQSLFGKLVSGVTNNPLQAAGIGLAGAGLGYNILQGSKDSDERKALGANAKTLGAQGKELMGYLQSGTLPPGLQAQVTKDTEAARARVIQNHAQNGMPTDPSQNSALAQELNNVDTQASIKIAQIGERLMAQGISEIGLSDDLYAKLIGIDKAQAQSTGYAISNFAAALAGRPPQGQQQQRAA